MKLSEAKAQVENEIETLESLLKKAYEDRAGGLIPELRSELKTRRDILRILNQLEEVQ